MNKIYKLIILIAGLTASSLLWGQDMQSVVRERHYNIYFRVSNADIDAGFRDNAATLEKIKSEVGELMNLPGIVADSLIFLSSASPEGPYEANKRFAQKRAINTKSMLSEMFPSFSEAKIRTRFIDEEWEGLASLIETDEEIENRAEIVEIIRTSTTSRERKERLRKIDNGVTANMIYQKYCGDLRYCIIVIKFIVDPDQQTPAVEKAPYVAVRMAAPATAPLRIPEVIPTQPKTFERHITLKTNTFGWALGQSNIAVEADICKHLSIAVPFYYSGGFDYFKETIKFRGIVLQPELRYYPMLTDDLANGGLFVGAHFGLGWYNFALNGDYRIQDHGGNTPAWGGGLGVGYSMQFKKNPRWGMEFELGGGVYKATYDTFYNESNGPFDQQNVEKVWFGVDNAAVSFTYKFDMKKKGGKN